MIKKIDQIFFRVKNKHLTDNKHLTREIVIGELKVKIPL